jgi:hypothetical protein
MFSHRDQLGDLTPEDHGWFFECLKCTSQDVRLKYFYFCINLTFNKDLSIHYYDKKKCSHNMFVSNEIYTKVTQVHLSSHHSFSFLICSSYKQKSKFKREIEKKSTNFLWCKIIFNIKCTSNFFRRFSFNHICNCFTCYIK